MTLISAQGADLRVPIYSVHIQENSGIFDELVIDYTIISIEKTCLSVNCNIFM